MKNLSINIAKNVVINDLVCTPNTVVLAKQTTTERNGEVTTTVRYIEVCSIDKTDSLTIVKSLLKYCIAEFFVCKEFETEFADTNIKQRKLFNQFLSTNKIYRTNSEGKIASAIESEVALNQTALKVNNNHTIANCKRENLKAAIHQHAKAIVAQSKHISTIVAKVETLETLETATTPATTPEVQQPQKRGRKPSTEAQVAA